MALKDTLRDLAKKAEIAAADHKDQIGRAIAKVEQVGDQHTKGKYHDQISRAGAKAGAYLDGLRPPEPTPEQPPAGQPPAAPPPGVQPPAEG